MSKKYDIIYMDPPWFYGKTFWHAPGVTSTIEEKHYPTMKMHELEALPIYDMLNEDALVYMWVTPAFMEKGIKLANTWGLKYSSVGFVWQKDRRIMPGFYTLGSTEYVLIFKKGRIPKPRGARNVRQFLIEDIREHSRKPDEIRRRIEEMHPTQSKLEMFARIQTPGWDVWGNETDKFKE